MAWDHRQYGTAADPIRQSDLGRLASAHSCPKRFAYEKNERMDGVRERTSAPWKACIGTASHETIKRILTRAEASVLAGKVPPVDQVLSAVNDEMERAAEGLPIDWRGESPASELMEAAHMVRGAVRTIGQRAKRIVLVEAPFKLELDRDGKIYHATGTLDVLYESHEDKLVLADWKTGDQIMPQVILDHGYQFGMYGEACARATFFPGEERELVIGQSPFRSLRLVRERQRCEATAGRRIRVFQPGPGRRLDAERCKRRLPRSGDHVRHPCRARPRSSRATTSE
jgi:hypothetical protein